MFTMLAVIVLALLIDQLLGEPRRYHPLVGFGHVATRIEKLLNRATVPVARSWSELILEPVFELSRKGRGVVAWALVVGVPVLIALLLQVYLHTLPWWLQVVGEALVVYLAIGRKSLIAHARAVGSALQRNDILVARRAVALIVSRDTGRLDATQVSTAAVETVLENGSDAIFASLFWYALAGLPGVVLHRAANTLDAMWGYRNERFLQFGWFAARSDDALNYLPARLTALAYALSGHVRTALRCWREQAPRWSSPNGGPVMAAGAGALQLRLGGPAPYDGEWEERPLLGAGRQPDAGSIDRALSLLDRSVLIWLGALLLIAAVLRWVF